MVYIGGVGSILAVYGLHWRCTVVLAVYGLYWRCMVYSGGVGSIVAV